MSVLNNAAINIPSPLNEPVLSYAPGTPERQKIKASLEELKSKQIEIPLIIGGKEVRTGNLAKISCPHDHSIQLGSYHKAGAKEVQLAIDAAMAAKPVWEKLRWEERAAIFLKAADLLAGPYRFLINAATMLNISKNPFQAEIDAACELIDFLRFNVYFAQQVYEDQPMHSSPQVWNYVQHRQSEGDHAQADGDSHMQWYGQQQDDGPREARPDQCAVRDFPVDRDVGHRADQQRVAGQPGHVQRLVFHITEGHP